MTASKLIKLKKNNQNNTEAESKVNFDDSLIPNKERLIRIAQLEGNVIITGESGTGKSMCARAIHAYSNRSEHDIIFKGCGGITDSLFNSELIGHTKGAFTGAIKDKVGLVEQAHMSTLVLDDFDCLSETAQQSLLHVIENKTIIRIGDDQNAHQNADVRYIVTTNSSPEELIEKGTLRADFFRRLARWRLHIPPLHERPNEVRHAIKFYTSQFNNQFKDKSHKRSMSKEVEQLLCHLNWPGNFRQIQEVVENLIAFANHKRTEITLKYAVKVIFDDINFPRNRELVSFAQLKDPQSVSKLLHLMKGNKVLVAKLLGCSRTKLYEVIKDHKL